MKDYDFLVIGGGIAGLTYALEVSKHGSVAVLFKKSASESSTNYAQGGIAAVSSPDDNFELHIKDTLIAGAGLCNQEVVELVVKEGPARVKELIERGAQFDKGHEGNHFDLHREGGHSKRRILHSADTTGQEIQRALVAACQNSKNISFYTNYSAIDLVTTQKLNSESQDNSVVGAYVLDPNGKVLVFKAKKILVATGGAGKVYLYTSNPDVASGDGIAMCYRAGASVENMEFIQFHPTCLFHPKAKSFLISEALRGEGAILKTIDGKRFMPEYHELAELAPRDVVARAIDREMKLSGNDYVYLDISHQPPELVKEKFPAIYKRCLEFGIDITTEPAPVVPAAHYFCGGVATDSYGRTQIKNLYAAGECACTGLHGANRLASNSLLEGLVFAYRAAQDSIATLDENKLGEFDIPAWDSGSATDADELVLINQAWDEIRRFMWNYVGIVRSNKRLKRALKRSELIEQEILEYYWNFIITPDLLELRNLSLIANLIIRAASARKESRGLHYNVDYPETGRSTPTGFNHA